jgi:hypothetical protein
MEGSGRGLTWCTILVFASKDWGILRTTSVRISGVPTEIWTCHSWIQNLPSVPLRNVSVTLSWQTDVEHNITRKTHNSKTEITMGKTSQDTSHRMKEGHGKKLKRTKSLGKTELDGQAVLVHDLCKKKIRVKLSLANQDTYRNITPSRRVKFNRRFGEYISLIFNVED